MLKRFLFSVFLFALLFFAGCYDYFIKIRVFRSGYTHIKITARTILCGTVNDVVKSYRRAGLRNVSYWFSNNLCYVTGEYYGKGDKSFSFGKFLTGMVSAKKKSGLFKTVYSFKYYTGSYDAEIARDREFLRAFAKSSIFSYSITMPGKIIRTSPKGRISKDGKTVHFSFSLYTLSLGRKQIVVVSEEKRLDFSPQHIASNIIDEKENEITSLKMKIKELEKKIQREKKFSKNASYYYSSSNRWLVNILNRMVMLYRKEKKEYPANKDELFAFLKSKGIDVTSLPEPLPKGKYKLVYDEKLHRFLIKKI